MIWLSIISMLIYALLWWLGYLKAGKPLSDAQMRKLARVSYLCRLLTAACDRQGIPPLADPNDPTE